MIKIPVSAGELVDKLTILEIKLERITAPAMLENVRKEHALLRGILENEIRGSKALDELAAALRLVNRKLWDIEDDIRALERQKDYGARFVELARAVYLNNDERSAFKRKINELTGSAIVEEKLYQKY